MLSLLLVMLPVAASGAGPQPDLAVKLVSESDAAYLGAGVYEPEPATQFKFQAVPTGSAARFQLSVRNAGDAADTLVLSGKGSGSGFTVRYLDQAADVTGRVIAGNYRMALATGASTSIRVEVTPGDLPIGTTYEVTVGAASLADASRVDRLNLDTVTCGSTPGVTITTPADGKAAPGGSTVYPYTVTNVGTGNNSFTLNIETGSGSAVIVADDGAGGGIANDGVRQPGETNATSSTGTLAPGGNYNFFVVVTVPPGSTDGSRFATTTTATGPGANASDQVSTTTTAAVFTVLEDVRNVTQSGPFAQGAQAAPGDILEYRMTLINSGSAPVPALSVQSPLPLDTALVSGSLHIAVKSTGEGSCAPALCGEGTESRDGIGANVGEGANAGTGGTLAPGRTLYVFYRVMLQ